MTFSLIDLQQTAVHEAGHAIMARSLGLNVREVSIVPEGDRLGVCFRQVTDNWRARYAVTMAGPWAAGQWFDEDTSGLTDWTKAEEILNDAMESGELPDDAAGLTRAVQSLEAEIDTRLQALRPQIETLAKELLFRQTMTGDEIEALFNSPPKDADASPAKVISEIKAGDPARKSYGTQRLGDDDDPQFDDQPTAGHGVGP